jgi:MFS family permease
MGFTIVMPFLPLYFRELGVSDEGAVAIWSGASIGITPAVTAMMSPFWGKLADRYGRKVMVERSLVCFVIVLTIMSKVTEPWHVLALRIVQGIFGGFGPLTLTMAADSAPRDQMGSALGTVQSVQRLGPAIGPAVGGVLAPVFGLRQSFLVAAAMYGAALVTVVALYREPRRHQSGHEAGDSEKRLTFRNVLAFENFVLLMGVLFGIQLADRSLAPILPLFVDSLGTPDARIAFVSGLLFSAAAVAVSVGNRLCVRLMRRLPARRIISGAASLSACAALMCAMAGNVTFFALALSVFGLGTGIGMTAAYTTGGSLVPAAVHGTGFGLLTSASLAGLAIGPILSGLVAAQSIRAVFLLEALTLIVVALVVSRVMVEAPAQTRTPTVEGV